MIVLSLFDGMSCGQIALERAGIEIEEYYASEIDKPAIKVTLSNYPGTKQLGDITKWQDWDIPWHKINLVLAGSPCQGFSFAGKQLAFDDPRSALFFVFVDILREVQSWNQNVKFLLENVRMKKEHLAVISKYMGVEPIFINSALVSAQNRRRYYWTNIEGVGQPEDKGVLLKDILHSGSQVDGKYFISNEAINRFKRKKYSTPKINPDKTGTLNTKNNSGQLSIDSGTTLIGVLNNSGVLRKIDKSSCLDTNYHKGVDNHAQRTMVFTKNYIQWDTSGKWYKSQQDRAFYVEGKHDSLPSARAIDKTKVFLNGGSIRRLTPIECERLQTVPDNYTCSVSDTQRYKMLGNGWTVDVISHIFKNL